MRHLDVDQPQGPVATGSPVAPLWESYPKLIAAPEGEQRGVHPDATGGRLDSLLFQQAVKVPNRRTGRAMLIALNVTPRSRANAAAITPPRPRAMATRARNSKLSAGRPSCSHSAAVRPTLVMMKRAP